MKGRPGPSGRAAAIRLLIEALDLVAPSCYHVASGHQGWSRDAGHTSSTPHGRVSGAGSWAPDPVPPRRAAGQPRVRQSARRTVGPVSGDRLGRARFGGSTDPTGGASLDDWADWLAEFAYSLGLSAVHLAGLSWGGGLAIAVAHRHPNLVRSLILMSAYAGWGGSLPPDEVERRLDLTMANTRRPPEEWIPALLDTLLPPGSHQHLVDQLTTMLSESHPVATRIALTAFANADLRPVLEDLDVPTLLIYGALDTRSPAEVWEPLHRAIPGSKLIVIPDVGHMVDLQAPARCNAEIAAFLGTLEAT